MNGQCWLGHVALISHPKRVMSVQQEIKLNGLKRNVSCNRWAKSLPTLIFTRLIYDKNTLINNNPMTN
jgi:hypothetical protein